jgi:hypothetical protein
MRTDSIQTMTRQERLKYEAASELGLLDRLIKVGWGGLTAGETGRIGAAVARKLRQG